MGDYLEMCNDAEKFNETRSNFHESLKDISAAKVKENFMKTLDKLKASIVQLCDIWKVISPDKVEDEMPFHPCEIPPDIQLVQDQLQEKNDIVSVVEVFGNSLNKDSYKWIEEISLMENDHPEDITLTLMSVKLTPTPNDSDFAKSVKSITNRMIGFEKLYQWFFYSVPLVKTPILDLKSFKKSMKKSYSTAKNLVLILSYYLSLEKSRVSEDIVGSSLPHEAEEFRHHLKTLQKLIKSKFEIWNGKDDTYKAK